MSDKMENDLQFVRIFTPVHIPEYLVEQVKEKEYTKEQFYKYQEVNCIMNVEGTISINPLNLLYVIVDSKKEVKGFCWMAIDALTKDLVIQTFSMHSSYWNGGKCIEILKEKVKEIMKECNIRKVYWITKHPKHAERYGFKRSKSVLIEYDEKEEQINEDQELKEKKEGSCENDKNKLN